MSEIRKDPITGRWVIINTEFRQQLTPVADNRMPKTHPVCPFCPGNESLTPQEISAWRPAGSHPNDKDWKIRIIPNQFPLLRVEGQLEPRGEGLYDKLNGIGANEVLIASPEHDQDLGTLPVEQVDDVLWAVRERFLDLRHDTRIRYIQAYKNHGELAGATMDHPHLQLVGLPLIPRLLQEELEGAQRHQSGHGRCLFCDIIRQEIHHPERLVIENELFVILAPYASRVPFEICILPKQHAADYTQLAKGESRVLARSLQDILVRLNKVLRNPAYNLILHTLPCQPGKYQDFHWHLELLPRLSRVTGFEWGTDFYINPTSPEEAALFLRQAGA